MKSIIGPLKDGIDKIHYAWKDFPIPYEKAIAYYPAPNKKVAPKRDEHASVYIGKMTKGKDGIYTKDSLVGMIQCLAHSNYKNGDRIHIQLCSILYECLADSDMKQAILSYDDQKDIISALIRDLQLPGHAQNYIQISNLYDNHKELFNAIKLHGIDVLKNNTSLDKDNSLQIASLLYQSTQKYPEIKKSFFSLVPADLQSQLHESDNLQYYGLLEIACRISDLLHGISLQGGFIRQKKYDNLISRIISGQTGSEEFDTYFSEFSKTDRLDLSKRYFENSTYRGLIKQKDKHHKEQKEVRKKIFRKTGITAALLAAALTGGIVNNQYIKEKEKQQEQEFFNKISKEKGKKNMYGYVDLLNPKEALAEWNTCIDRARGAIQERYKIDEDKVGIAKAEIGDCFLQDTIHATDIFTGSYEGDFATEQQQRNAYIDSQIIAKHPYIRQKLGVNNKPYQYLDYNLLDMFNTILANEKIEGIKDGKIKNNKTTTIGYWGDKKFGVAERIKNLSYLGEYFVADIEIYRASGWGDDYGLDEPTYFIAKSYEGREEYDLALSKRAALKIFYERFENIQKCVQAYIKLHKADLGHHITNILVGKEIVASIYGEQRDIIVEKILYTLAREHKFPLIPSNNHKEFEKIFQTLDKPFSSELINTIVTKVGP